MTAHTAEKGAWHLEGCETSRGRGQPLHLLVTGPLLTPMVRGFADVLQDDDDGRQTCTMSDCVSKAKAPTEGSVVKA